MTASDASRIDLPDGAKCRRVRETGCTGFSDSPYVANKPGYESYVCPAPCQIRYEAPND